MMKRYVGDLVPRRPVLPTTHGDRDDVGAVTHRVLKSFRSP